MCKPLQQKGIWYDVCMDYCAEYSHNTTKLMEYIYHYKSPLGVIQITSTATAITGALFIDTEKRVIERKKPSVEIPAVISRAIDYLDAYFSGTKKSCTIPMEQKGTQLQRAVWDALKTIPYGSVCTYEDLATMIGNPRAVRAVANAVGANNLLILIPCHRVIRKDGSMGGFGADPWRKEELLMNEAR